ncbi:MAG: GNAT family N-acetyltransferase [Bosea sp.]|nr:GNAT family N-acetyltransferase [Bosea sp. (in: a-proteobacteria)]
MIDNPTIVRFAEPADADGIVSMIAELHDENGLFPLSRRRVEQFLRRYYDKQGAIIGVIGDVGAPVASIYLAFDQPYYSDAFFLNESWNFVRPEHRRSDYAKQLIAFAKHCSDQMKVPLMVGIVSNHRTEAKIRLYERSLEKAGAYFVHNRHFLGETAWDKDR